MRKRNLRREALAVALLHSRAEGEGSRLNSPNEFNERSTKAPMASPLTGTVLTSSLRFVGARELRVYLLASRRRRTRNSGLLLLHLDIEPYPRCGLPSHAQLSSVRCAVIADGCYFLWI